MDGENNGNGEGFTPEAKAEPRLPRFGEKMKFLPVPPEKTVGGKIGAGRKVVP